MVDEIIMVFVSAIITAVGFFTVKWMTSIDGLIDEVNKKIEDVHAKAVSLEHDHVPLREYLDNINSFKNNYVIVQNKLIALEQAVNQTTAVTTDLKNRVSDIEKHTQDPRGSV